MKTFISENVLLLIAAFLLVAVYVAAFVFMVD